MGAAHAQGSAQNEGEEGEPPHHEPHLGEHEERRGAALRPGQEHRPLGAGQHRIGTQKGGKALGEACCKPSEQEYKPQSGGQHRGGHYGATEGPREATLPEAQPDDRR